MKRWKWIAATLVVAGGAFAVAKIDAMVGVGAGYMAKVACSEIFLAKRDQAAVIAGEFHDISPVLDRVRLKIDAAKKTVSGSAFGLGRAKAVFRDGYGCTLVRGGAPETLMSLEPVTDKPLASARAGTDEERSDVDYAAIDAAFDSAFADEKAATRAILVVKDGAIIADRYADGFTAETPFLSWSMAKSVTASMVGAAVLQGMIDVDGTPGVPEWARKGDPRNEITWTNLLQMQSGLAFDETYDNPNSDVSKMLFRARSAGKIAADQPPAHKPGTFWSYSSGTTNLIQRSLRDTLEGNDTAYQSFARDRIFAAIGAASFVAEPDSSGTFIGSSFIYATAQDWAKLGMLYLNDGVIDGIRLLPKGWSDYVATPASASDGFYGAQFWLNHPGATDRPKYMPGVPDDAYLMAGHEGQYVLIVPDKHLIIVRTGMTRGVEPMPLVAPVFAAIYAAIGQ